VLLLDDFDGDGDADLVAINAGQDIYYQNTGAGSFVAVAGKLPADLRHDMHAVSLDLEGDGDRDIVTMDSGGLRVLRNDGVGFVEVQGAVPNVGPVRRFLSVGDFDGSGSDDLAIGGLEFVVHLLNDGAGTFALASTDAHWMSVALDLEGDGDLDRVQLRDVYADYQIHRNDGAGNLVAVARELPRSLANQFGGGAVDLDLDGDLDVVATGESSPNVVYRNDGAGRFESVAYGAFTSGPSLSVQAAIADLDGDQLPEVVVARSSSTSGCQVYRNSGVSLDPVPAFGFAANAVQIGDLDGDGDLDLYFACNQQDRVLLNQGGLGFVQLAGAVQDPTRTWVVALSDVDADGDLDAIAAGLFGEPTRLLRNDGTGNFTVVPNALPAVTGNSQHIVAADLDGDGDDDLLIANDGGPNHLFVNDGTGQFTDSSVNLPAGHLRTMHHAVADLDGDGDLDLLECSFLGPLRGRLLRNDGSGVFSVVPGAVPAAPSHAHEFHLGDYDRDGDLDAFLLVQGSAVLYRNLSNQLRWTVLPRVGASIELAVNGAANAPYALAATALRTIVPSPIGVLHVDLNTLLLLEVGAFDANGEATHSYPVPNLPALAGLEIHWQNVTFGPLLLGNLETTELLFR
ncbi:MAG: VCBS repeat-containing protein, partial [Planctomycetes bacterium]|nr:VCBS repeat-containing protein [Planctomycetota bacterium]